MIDDRNADEQPAYRLLTSAAESQAAIDEVLAAARATLRIFDVSLAGRGYNAPARIQLLRNLLVAGRAHRILIALHDTGPLEREAPRLLALLRQFPMSLEIHRTTGQARNANDPFVLADDQCVWRQMHYQQPRAMVAMRSPADVVPILQRFDEIWELSEPAVSASTLGL